jgi:hypothetical protein
MTLVTACSCFGLSLLTGCALQATAGPGAVGHADSVASVSAAATMHALRKSNGIVGMRVGMRVDDGLSLKHGILHGGNDFLLVPGWLTLEPGLDLGAGRPFSPVFTGVGAYAGVSGTARFRVTPGGDREPAFNIAYPMVELVFMPRLGAWMPPEGSNTTTPYAEWSVEFGVRLAVGSDLFSPAQGKISDGGEATKAPPGDVR